MKKILLELKGVVFINQTLSMGGAENFYIQLLTWFKRKNIPVKAWTTFPRLIKGLKANHIKTGKIPVIIDIIGDWKGLIKGIAFSPFALFYYAILSYKNRKSGTFFLAGYIEKILVTPWAKLFRAPVVWVEFGPLETIFSKFWGMPKFLYNLVSKLPDYVIEPSINTREHNINITGISPETVCIIPCGIGPLSKVIAKPMDYSAYCVSRMEPGKGQDLLIKAWPKVVERYPQAKLYFIGEGDFRPALEGLVTDLRIRKSVIFMGWVDNLAKSVAPMSLAIFPSVWALEGLSLVFMEAMSIGKPIVCFGWGSNLELVDNKCALMVPKGDINALSNAIKHIFSDPKLAEELGRNAKKRFNDRFVIDKTAPQYVKVLIEAQNAVQSGE